MNFLFILTYTKHQSNVENCIKFIWLCMYKLVFLYNYFVLILPILNKKLWTKKTSYFRSHEIILFWSEYKYITKGNQLIIDYTFPINLKSNGILFGAIYRSTSFAEFFGYRFSLLSYTNGFIFLEAPNWPSDKMEEWGQNLIIWSFFPSSSLFFHHLVFCRALIFFSLEAGLYLLYAQNLHTDKSY